MHRNSKSWTSVEDSKLIAQVKANPQNLTRAFVLAAQELGRTKGACCNRWYSVISKSYKDNPDNVCFAVFSRKRYGVNRKNLREESTVRANNSLWHCIITFIKRISKK